MSSNYTITDPNLCGLMLNLLPVSLSTEPLERPYSKLSKLFYKDRNKLKSNNLEIFYLLGTLREPVSINYEKAYKLLQKQLKTKKTVLKRTVHISLKMFKFASDILG